MITQKKMLELREQMLQNKLFFSSYNIAIEWAKDYTALRKERFSLADHFRMLMIKNKWSRQAGYAFLSFIHEDYKLSDLITGDIQADLTDLESRILGQCEPAQIIRFHNDPADVNELAKYVRSEAWLTEEFYKA